MANNLEKNFQKKKKQDQQLRFRQNLIKTIIESSVENIRSNTQGQPIRTKDIAEVVTPMLDAYKNSETTRQSLGIADYTDWDRFFDDVINAIERKLNQAAA